jgi:lysophospholipase L1-like esterase
MLNIIFVGDALLASRGDARALGWVGRVISRTAADLESGDISHYALPMPDETSLELYRRIETEVAPRVLGVGGRSAGAAGGRVTEGGVRTASAAGSSAVADGIGAAGKASNFVVVQLGSLDMVRTSETRSRLNLAHILENIIQLGAKPFVVGPAPKNPEYALELHKLNEGYKDVTQRRAIPYVDLLASLSNHENYMDDIRKNDYQFPSQIGYGLIAWLVLNSGWNEYIGM